MRRTFSTHCVYARKQLYLMLVRSQLLYCSQLWRPILLKDIVTLERLQRRASKFILNDYTSSYKSRLIQLSLLPLTLPDMMGYKASMCTFCKPGENAWAKLCYDKYYCRLRGGVSRFDWNHFLGC